MMRCFLGVMLLLPAVITQPSAQDDERAAAEHEARAQKALADSLTDALAMLKHGSARAREEAAGGIANLAVETTITQPFHPVTFRNACVRAGILEELVRLLNGDEDSATSKARFHALAALEAIATDDPTTELDNGHALATCNAGAVPPVVRLLSSNEVGIQVAAAGCAAVLAENPQCQTLLLKHGAVRPLLALSRFGGDAAKLKSLAALDLLSLNNPAAHDEIAKADGLKILQGVRKYSNDEMRAATTDLLAGVSSPDQRTVTVDTAGHARQAHQARLRHSKVWQSATPMKRAQAPQQQPEEE